MKRGAYFREANRLSNVFGEKLDELKKFWDADPELKGDGAYEKYWELQNAAQAAAGEWTDFCAKERHLIED